MWRYGAPKAMASIQLRCISVTAAVSLKIPQGAMADANADQPGVPGCRGTWNPACIFQGPHGMKRTHYLERVKAQAMGVSLRGQCIDGRVLSPNARLRAPAPGPHAVRRCLVWPHALALAPAHRLQQAYACTERNASYEAAVSHRALPLLRE